MATQAQHAADLLFVNGRVFTMDQHISIQPAIIMRGLYIHAIGSTADIQRLTRPHTRRMDLQGRTIIPSIIDTHAHMDREGLKNILSGSKAYARSPTFWP